MKQFLILTGTVKEIETKMSELYAEEAAGQTQVVPLGFSSDNTQCYQPVILIRIKPSLGLPGFKTT